MQYFKRLALYDNLELMSLDCKAKSFPLHYHDSYCISLIRHGVEQMIIDGKSIYTGAGLISIANPYQIHSNEPACIQSNLCFDTIYVSPDLMASYALNGKVLLPTQINDGHLNFLFSKLRGDILTEVLPNLEISLSLFLEYLTTNYQMVNPSECVKPHNFFTHGIDAVLKENVRLEALAGELGLDKFSFSKKFKNSVGMSPINYVLMKKIFKAKDEIDRYSNLTEIAYAYDFTDVAHFSNTFKRFVGVAPSTYQKGLNE